MDIQIVDFDTTPVVGKEIPESAPAAAFVRIRNAEFWNQFGGTVY